mmetsp:Transcript_33145/g.51394  ORF Transcript_33145/g.51394 Transcript_33145/m.51394 type:complete len:265 (+) Transcript_33145:1641-2435(+)
MFYGTKCGGFLLCYFFLGSHLMMLPFTVPNIRCLHPRIYPLPEVQWGSSFLACFLEFHKGGVEVHQYVGKTLHWASRGSNNNKPKGNLDIQYLEHADSRNWNPSPVECNCISKILQGNSSTPFGISVVPYLYLSGQPRCSGGGSASLTLSPSARPGSIILFSIGSTGFQRPVGVWYADNPLFFFFFRRFVIARLVVVTLRIAGCGAIGVVDGLGSDFLDIAHHHHSVYRHNQDHKIQWTVKEQHSKKAGILTPLAIRSRRNKAP